MARSEPAQFDVPGAILAGTLHLPDGPGPHPAMVMLQGSGVADRESGGFFPPIRAAFLDVGIGVLSWDKPGVGESTGDWRQRTIFDRADEAVAAVDWLRAHSAVDAGRIGIWGHSQGGWVGPLTASRIAHPAFLVINSGPGIGIDDQDLYGVEQTLRSAGGGDAEVAEALAWTRAVHEAARRGDPYDKVAERLLRPAAGTHAGDYFAVDSPEFWGFLVGNAQRPYDPVAALERITCPVLAIFGELDRLVPVDKSVGIFKDAFARAGNTDVTIRVYPGADHRIRVGEPLRFADGYLAEMAAWVAARADMAA